MDISVLYIIPNDRIIETVQRVMQRCDVNYPVYYGTMSGALEIAKRMIAQGSRVIVSTGLTALYCPAQSGVVSKSNPFYSGGCAVSRPPL